MESFSMEIPFNDEEAMKDFNAAMDELTNILNRQAEELAKEFGISKWCAQNIFYLRSRSRWTQEKEDYLIWLEKNSKELPDYNDDFEVPENYK